MVVSWHLAKPACPQTKPYMRTAGQSEAHYTMTQSSVVGLQGVSGDTRGQLEWAGRPCGGAGGGGSSARPSREVQVNMQGRGVSRVSRKERKG